MGLFFKKNMINKKIKSEVGIGIILILAIIIGAIIYTQSKQAHNSTAESKNNTIAQKKDTIENKQTWHIENDSTYVDDAYNFSAQFPNGWYLEESLPVGPNEGGWKRRISFSNYDFKNNFNISNLPSDYKVFEFILEGMDDCNKVKENGYVVTTDIAEWKKSFDTIKQMSKDYPSLSAAKILEFNNSCLSVDALFPENNGANVTASEKIDILKGFARSFEINSPK